MQNPRILPPKAPYEYRDGREGEARNEGKSFGRAGKLLQPGEKGKRDRRKERTDEPLLPQQHTRSEFKKEMKGEVVRQLAYTLSSVYPLSGYPLK